MQSSTRVSLNGEVVRKSKENVVLESNEKSKIRRKRKKEKKKKKQTYKLEVETLDSVRVASL